MYKLKLIAISLILISCIQMPSLAACSTRTLNKVCDLCEERALSKLDTDSICPKQTCPEVNCPSASLSCMKLDSFELFLKPHYTITATIGEENLNFKLNTSKNPELFGTFNYIVRTLNYRVLIDNAIGFLLYDIINFHLPVTQGEKLLSYSCTGSIDNSSTIKGICSTIAPDKAGKLSEYGFRFTGLPSDSPL